MKKLFPSDELDVFVLAQFPTPLTPDSLEKLRDIHFDLGLADNVSNLVSMFSVHQRDPTDGSSIPVIPEELPSGEAFRKLAETIRTDGRFANRLYAQLTPRAASALYVIALDPKAVKTTSVEQAVEQLNNEVQALGENADVKLAMTGAPVMTTELLAASRRDSAVFNVAGFAMGLIICFVFFQRWQYILIVLTPNALGAVHTWLDGAAWGSAQSLDEHDHSAGSGDQFCQWTAFGVLHQAPVGIGPNGA